MNEEEIKSLIAQLKGVGLTDEEIMDTFFAAFKKGNMEKDDLKTLANAMGYDLSKEFEEDEGPKGIENAPTESELEDIKTIKPEESKEEFKEKAEDLAEKMPGADGPVADDKSDDEPADAEADKDEAPEADDKSLENDIGDGKGESKPDDKDSSDDESEWDEAQKLFRI